MHTTIALITIAAAAYVAAGEFIWRRCGDRDGSWQTWVVRATCWIGWPVILVLGRIFGPAIVAKEEAMIREMFTEAEREYLFGHDRRRPLARQDDCEGGRGLRAPDPLFPSTCSRYWPRRIAMTDLNTSICFFSTRPHVSLRLSVGSANVPLRLSHSMIVACVTSASSRRASLKLGSR